jgi:hypothetical protein
VKTVDQRLMEVAQDGLKLGRDVYAVIRGAPGQTRISAISSAVSGLLIQLTVPPESDVNEPQDVYLRPEDLLTINVTR